MAGVDDASEGEEARPGRGSRRKRVALIVAGVLVLLVMAPVGYRVVDRRPTFAYRSPSGPVSPGEEVTVQAPNDACGPLIVSLHEEGILGFWNQTHSGNVFSGFARDEHRWWALSSREHMTPVPCSPDGTITFVVPRDVSAGTIAACDMDGKCARVRIARDDNG